MLVGAAVIDMFPTDLFRFQHPVYPISFSRPSVSDFVSVSEYKYENKSG
jgi:hypothetical protein